jgi:ABC-type glycerol-3-phosphate transport system substrate-binding protein
MLKPWSRVGLAVGAALYLSVGFAQGAIERIPDDLFPLTEERQTLRVFMGGNASVEDFETNAFTQWYEEQTNVDIEFNIAAGSAADVTQGLNLMLASGDLPDVILSGNVSTSQLALYGQQGVFLPLNDLIEEHGIETKRIFEIYPEAGPSPPRPTAISTRYQKSTSATTARSRRRCGSISPG